MSADPMISFRTEKTYQCDRGHTWTAVYLDAGISIQLPGGPTTPYCTCCLKEWADANLGTITEVK